MSKRHITGTRAEIAALIAEEEDASGYPIEGVLVDEYSQPGFETAWAKPRPHPTIRGLFSMPIRDTRHSKRIVGKRVVGRTITRGDVVARDASWRRRDDDE